MDAAIHTPLCDLLGIRVPILLAPMAGGPGTPELVAAVTGAGGLGVIGATGMTCAGVDAAVRRALELAGPPVGVNVLLAPPEPGAGDADAVERLLAPFRAELGLPAGPASAPASDPPLALVDAALAAGAGVVTTAMGDPAPVAAAARAAGAPLIAMVSTAEEARRSAAAGADAVIAQGAEAGGHRATFAAGPEPPLVGTFALVPRVVDAIDRPVIAAGGIMDGRGLAAALALGAQGVSLGTRFLLTPESGVPDVYRRRLLVLEDGETVVTAAVTGRPARWVRNRITDALRAGPASLGWPAQAGAVAGIRAGAGEAGDAELLPMLAGQGAGLVGMVRPAGEIVAELARDAERILRGLAPPRGW